MKLSVTLLFTLLTFSALQSFAQADSLKFQEKEKGFITKDGCKILVKQYYGLSENHYYFRVDNDKTYYYVDTNEVAAVQNIKIGKNKELASEKYPGLKRGIWVGTCLVLGPIGVLGVAGTGALLIWQNSNSDFWVPFVAFLPGNTLLFFVITTDAFEKLKLVKAFKTGKPFVCQ